MDIVNTITLTAAGGTILYLAVQRYARKDKVEMTVDERAANLIQTATKPFQDVITRMDTIVEEERAAKSKAEDARDAAVQNLVLFMEKSQAAHTDLTDRMRGEFTDSLKRIHDRVTTNEQDHMQCRTELAAANKRIEALEARERESLRNAPAPGTPMTIIPVQVPPAPHV